MLCKFTNRAVERKVCATILVNGQLFRPVRMKKILIGAGSLSKYIVQFG